MHNKWHVRLKAYATKDIYNYGYIRLKVYTTNGIYVYIYIVYIYMVCINGIYDNRYIRP